MKLDNGKYQVISVIAQGGMGKVYLAKHCLLDEDVVVKELILKGKNPTEQREIEKQFMEEARLLYACNGEPIRHQTFPAIKDFFVENSRYYLVMDFILGKTMQYFISDGKRFNEDTVCWIADRVLGGLAFLHRKDIAHRDVKPANIIVNLGTHRAYLVDFGIAKRKIDPPENSDGKLTYTPYFASPEQYCGDKCDYATDIYSLGATMYYALTGVLPPEANKIKNEKDIKPPHEIDRSIHEQLSLVVLKAMKLNPVERFKNAGDMKEICDKVRMTFINQNWRHP